MAGDQRLQRPRDSSGARESGARFGLGGARYVAQLAAFCGSNWDVITLSATSAGNENIANIRLKLNHKFLDMPRSSYTDFHGLR